MRTLILLTISTFITACSVKNTQPQGSAGNIGTTIFYPKAVSPTFETAVKDFAQLLKKSTGKTYQLVQNSSQQGIVLQTTPNDRRWQGKTEGAFHIQGNTNALIISAKTDEGLTNGIYYYLEKLGFRWYMPGENWEITPKLKGIALKMDELVEPDFASRSMFGAGGLAAHPTIDPQNTRKKEWDDWMRRNRFTSTGKIVGHAGQAYNLSHKELLKKHPEYLAEIDGKRVAWSVNAKHCVSNNQFVDSYIKERLTEYEKKFSQPKNKYRTKVISVEPADGVGHCTCRQCLKIGTVSDRVFHLANEVAKIFQKKHPEATVGLMAYSEHADTPNFPIEKNISVMLVPYAFQTVATPETFIRKWRQKCSQLYIYDYFSTTIWAKDMPSFDYLYQMPERMKFWQKSGIEGIRLESTYSNGAMGIGLYLFSKLAWDVDADISAILEAFHQNMFQKAAVPMQNMTERWATDFRKAAELPFAYRDLAAARSKSKDPMVVKRIEYYEKYVEFIRLWVNYEKLPKKSAERTQKAQEIIQYIWQIYPSYMVHSSYLTDMICNILERENPQIKQKWAFRQAKKNPQTWNKVKNAPTVNAQKATQKGRQENPVIFEYENYSPRLEPLKDVVKSGAATTTKSRSIANQPVQFNMSLSNTMVTYLEKDETVKLSYSGKDLKYGIHKYYLSVTNEQGREVFHKDFILDEKWHDWAIKLKGKMTYTFHFQVVGAVVEVKMPTDISLAIRGKLASIKSPKQLYAYVPAGISEVIVETPAATQFQLMTPQGQPIKKELLKKDVYRIKLNAPSTGDFYPFQMKNHLFQFLNIPNLFYTEAIPANAVQPKRKLRK